MDEWYIPSRSLIIVIPKETGGKCGKNAEKCIKDAKNVINMVIHTTSEFPPINANLQVYRLYRLQIMWYSGGEDEGGRKAAVRDCLLLAVGEDGGSAI